MAGFADVSIFEGVEGELFAHHAVSAESPDFSGAARALLMEALGARRLRFVDGGSAGSVDG